MKHTPEPWEVKQVATSAWAIVPAEHEELVIAMLVAQAPGDEQYTLAEANRIVACVNALAGKNPEAVGRVVEALRNLMASVVQYASDFTDDVFESYDDFFAPVIVKAQSALSALEATDED